jgi:hypothetical protein
LSFAALLSAFGSDCDASDVVAAAAAAVSAFAAFAASL